MEPDKAEYLWQIHYSIHRWHYGKRVKIRYRCELTVSYYSERYGKWITVNKGFWSDGATGVIDVASFAWWVHDVICERWRWDDGSPITVLQSSMVLHDILKAEGRKIRARLWGSATFGWQLIKRPFRH